MKNLKLIKKTSFLIIFFVVILTPAIISGNSDYQLKITDANYDDLDSEGVQNDVFIDFIISAMRFAPETGVDHVNLFYTLKLPSGLTYEHLFELSLQQKRESFDLTINHYNVVTESGFYKATLILTYKTEKIISQHTIVFDPPSMGSGSPSKLIMLIY